MTCVVVLQHGGWTDGGVCCMTCVVVLQHGGWTSGGVCSVLILPHCPAAGGTG